MRVLVIGSGGREHALVWRLVESESVDEVTAAPGNAGIAQLAQCIAPPDLRPATLLRLAQEMRADLTVIGPEAPLVDGVVDAFRAAGQNIVGPTAAQARLEGSKMFAKQFFAANGIPTARYETTTSTAEVEAALSRSDFPVVVKADGLAAGKGVVVARNRKEAKEAASLLGPNLVIEEYLEGEEVSFIALCDGREALPLEPCQDHKRLWEGDQGPNTGGMGAYSDSHILTEEERRCILDGVIRPTVERTGFSGFLYAGLMMTSSGPKVLEFNARLGDPETQPLMQRIEGDFGELLLAAASGLLYKCNITWRREPSVCVVLASAGYPGNPALNVPIRGIARAEAKGVLVFHAGTKRNSEGQICTAGGRVLGVTASGADLREAITKTYAGVDEIDFEGMQFRRDIGEKGLRRYN